MSVNHTQSPQDLLVREKQTTLFLFFFLSFSPSFQEKGPAGSQYVVEYDSENFKLPEMIFMPSPFEARLHGTPSNTKVPKGQSC